MGIFFRRKPSAHCLLVVLSACALLLLVPFSADASACEPVTQRQALFLGETVDIQERGEWQIETSASRNTSNPGETSFGIETEHGFHDRMQWQLELESESDQAEADNEKSVTAGLGIAVRCHSPGPALRLDLSSTHDFESADTTGFARLIAGAPFAHGSWHAGASQGTSGSVRSYFGAAILHMQLTPLAFEARRESDEGIWQTLFSAGLYLYTTDSMELALGLAQLDDSDDMKRRLMLKLTGEF